MGHQQSQRRAGAGTGNEHRGLVIEANAASQEPKDSGTWMVVLGMEAMLKAGSLRA